MAPVEFLVTGARGQLGRAVMSAIAGRGLAAIGVGSAEMPLGERRAIEAAVGTHRPRCVLHLAAATNVDGCELDPLGAYRSNGLGTAWLAESCARHGAALVYVSTDFVFDGKATTPYPVDAAVAPLSAYGASKRLGEEAVLGHGRADFWVVRTSWVFGPGGRNFPRAILDRARSGQPLRVVTDQVGRPTCTMDLADALLDLWQRRGPGGIYHAANTGVCSWHGFAVAVLAAAGLGHVPVGEQAAAELKRPAPRPAYSVLDTSRLDQLRGRPLPDFRDAIRRYLDLDAAAAPPPSAGDGLGGKRY
ncbi:MAG: dTDP-4-dehydrorhamnose reductase [Planctomycetes bacterium]|nr:dTDP-4-dehydrorhamnose reductase [Planctomycetota bacterium]